MYLSAMDGKAYLDVHNPRKLHNDTIIDVAISKNLKE